MTTKRVIDFAYNSGIVFDGKKKFRNTMVGFAYEIYIPNRGFVQADTLEGIHKAITEYRKK